MRKPISRPIQNIGRWRSTPIVTATTPRRNAQRRRSASVLFPFKPNESPLPPTRLLFTRSEEHTSELQSLMRISYAVLCLKKKNTVNNNTLQFMVITITQNDIMYILYY